MATMRVRIAVERITATGARDALRQRLEALELEGLTEGELFDELSSDLAQVEDRLAWLLKLPV